MPVLTVNHLHICIFYVILVFFLQIRCFDAPLQPQALQDVKNIVEHHTPLGVYNDGLTLDGTFLLLCTLLIFFSLLCVCVCMCE